MTANDHRPMGERRFGRWNTLGTQTLALREIRRFTSVWTQTLAAPVATALLFMLIFVLALGDRRGDVMGLPFAQFLAPGIVMMTVLQNAFANTSSSLVISKVQGNIVDTLMPPLSASEIMLGYLAGGVARGALVAVAVALVVFPFAGVGIANPFWALIYVLLGATMMSLIGVLAGVYAVKFDQMAAITNFIVTPLSFLSGTFYSLETLPPAMSVISHANPVFYVIDGFRYGILGQSDSSPWLGALVVLATCSVLWVICYRFFATGYRLKS